MHVRTRRRAGDIRALALGRPSEQAGAQVLLRFRLYYARADPYVYVASYSTSIYCKYIVHV